MKLKVFLKEKALYLACHAAVLIFTDFMLVTLVAADGPEIAVMASILYLSGAAIPLITEFRRKKAFYDLLLSSYNKLDRKNLLAEIIQRPDFFEGSVLYDVLRGSNKACLEEINRYKNVQAEYREYIEMWVHEIKTPISSSRLIVQNNPGEAFDSIAEEIDSIESFVDQALFYARSSAVERDYIIKETSLKNIVYAALKRDSKHLIRAGVSVNCENLGVTVYSDSKWIEFILHQLIINAAKYARPDTSPRIEFSARETDNGCVLEVSDNGMGIAESELPRIFDKGFTGTNGRLRGKSTGMGLYICKGLCEKLGISISAESSPGAGATFRIVFPKSSMTDIV